MVLAGDIAGVVGADDAVSIHERGIVGTVIQGGLIADDVNDDAGLRIRQTPRLGDDCGTLGQAAVAGEALPCQQSEHGITAACGHPPRIGLTSASGKAFHRFERDPRVLCRHRSAESGHAVFSVGVEPHPAILVRLLATAPNTVGIAAEHDAVAHIPQPASAPPALPPPQRGGDLGVDGLGILCVLDQVGTRDHRGDMGFGDHSVPQTQRHLRKPVTQGNRLIHQPLAHRLSQGAGHGDAGTELGVRIQKPVVGGLRGDKIGMQRRDRLVLRPGGKGFDRPHRADRRHQLGHTLRVRFTYSGLTDAAFNRFEKLRHTAAQVIPSTSPMRVGHY